MISNFFNAYPVLAWTAVNVLVAVLVIMLFWEKIRWWWINTWYGFPIIGKLTRLSKELHKANDSTGWFKSERTLCQDYKRFVPVLSEYDFNQRMTYLHKAGDNGRSFTPPAIWVLIVSFVLVEALGFSYVLAGYTVPGASESTQKYAALGIAFIVSALCVFFTHISGHELYRSLKVKRARKDWIEDGGKSKLRSRSMPLKTPQHLDDNDPEYTQLSNRVGVDASFIVSWATLAFVLLIAVGATYVRMQSANKLIENAVRIEKSELSSQQNLGNGLDLTGASTVPEADAAVNLDADKKAVEEAAQYDLHGYWVTFIILAVLFFFLQLLGVLFGYRWGFAGQNSKDAFKSIGRGKYLTYNDFRAASQKYIDQAQNQLEDLQQRMIRRHAEEGTGVAVKPSKTFLAFLSESEQNASVRRTQEREAHHNEEHEAQAEHERTTERSKKARTVADNRSTDSADERAHAADLIAATNKIDTILAQIDAFGSDAEAKRRYLDTLSDDVFAQVKSALQERKAARDKNRKLRTAEIEDLL